MWILGLKRLICLVFSSLFRCDMTVTLINDQFTANLKRSWRKMNGLIYLVIPTELTRMYTLIRLLIATTN